MTEINFNTLDKTYKIVNADVLIQGSSKINFLKIWFGTYINGVFTPDLTLATDKTNVVGAIFTRPDGKSTWFINFAPQTDGSFLTAISGWVLRKYGTLYVDVQLKSLTAATTDAYNRVSLLVNEGTSLEDEDFVFTEADYDNIWDTIRAIEVNAENDLMVGTVTAHTQELPLSGLREVDGIQLSAGDKVLVTGQGDSNGIYLVSEDDWTLDTIIYENQVVSVDYGETYGGAMIKKLSDGTSKIVKNPERMKWRVI